jgi:chromosome segregation ATPase
MATIWRVYAILHEYCCKTDYDLIISEVSRKSEEENTKLKARIEENILTYQEKETLIMRTCDELRATTEVAENKTKTYVKHIDKLDDYIEDLRRRNEEEISIRKQFEAKLNELAYVGRDHDAKYYRAIEEIDEVLLKLDATDKDLQSYKAEAMNLRKTTISLETQIIKVESR